jgi:hypothetical protein
MAKWWKLGRPGSEVRHNVLLTAVIGATAVLAFCWGRHGAMPRATAQGFGARTGDQTPIPNLSSDYKSRVVAFIHGNIPITREDLGEYLIARFGAERVEFLVNRRIIEHACRASNIGVSDAEVDSQLKMDLLGFGPDMTEKRFQDEVLKRYNKSLYEWREDVIRPRLALSKFCQGKPEVRPTDEDIQKAFEARYGEKVKCRMIVLPATFRQGSELWAKVSTSEEEFDKAAKSQPYPQLAAQGGAIPPIHKHFGDATIEKAAFALKSKGDVTALLGMPDKTQIILKLVERIPPDTSKRLDDERTALSKDVAEMKLSQEIPKIFTELKKQAHPTILLRKETTPAEQDRRAVEQIRGNSGMPLPPALTPRGN